MSDKSPKVIPPFAAQPANSGGRIGDTDWMCPDVVCGNVNFARRNSCNRCGKERVDLKSKKKLGTEIGKSAADKSRGLFSADDWQCNKCANVNWARRQTCNVCNAPKFGEVEARTGYGGGYNERGTVEYRPKRDSDDDEYDEFGRRKKRKLKDCSSTHEKRSRLDEDDEPTEGVRAGEGRGRQEETDGPAGPVLANPEDEDEESGEEGDLSKYDLWGSEDEEGQSKTPPVASNNNPVESANESPKNKSKSPPSKNSDDKRRRKSESRSPSSRSSSSSSSSSDSSFGKAPRNRYDDFNLNSATEHSPPSPPGRKDRGRGDRVDRSEALKPRSGHRNTSAQSINSNSRHGGGLVAHSTTSGNHRSSSSHKVDSGRRHRAHRHRR